MIIMRETRTGSRFTSFTIASKEFGNLHGYLIFIHLGLETRLNQRSKSFGDFMSISLLQIGSQIDAVKAKVRESLWLYIFILDWELG